MICFLTSSPCPIGAPGLSNANGMVDELRECLPDQIHGLFVASSPDDFDACDRFGPDMKYNFELAGFEFESFEMLDRRTADQAEEMIARADLIILAGGHVPTQNAFFQDIGLRQLLEGYEGVLMGISAGTMNCADVVYAQPEEPGEAVDPDYERFLPGLGLTDINILPHYQMLKDDELDGMRLFEDISAGDSYGRCFYVFVDGTYLLVGDDFQQIRGECYVIHDGEFEQIAEENDVIELD